MKAPLGLRPFQLVLIILLFPSFVFFTGSYPGLAQNGPGLLADITSKGAAANRVSSGTSTIQAFPEQDFIVLRNGSLDRTYTLTIARASDPAQIVFTAAGTPNGGNVDIFFNYQQDYQGFDIQIGDFLTIVDGFSTWSMVIAPPGTLTIDVDTDIASGSSGPDQWMYIDPGVIRYAQADSNGQWSIDFHRPGLTAFDNGSPVMDLRPAMGLTFGEMDPNGNLSLYQSGCPNIDSIHVSASQVLIDETVYASIKFNDPAGDLGIAIDRPNANNGSFIVWDWGDGTTFKDMYLTGITSTAGHTYKQSGFYTITATVHSGGYFKVPTSEHYSNLIVAGSPAGLILGDGWYISPIGASPTNPALGSRATFSFAITAPKGLSSPVGLILFKIDNFSFTSLSFEWLAVQTGKLLVKGRGTVNGKGTYEFLLYASKDPTSGDRGKFRIKIWNPSSGQVVYDNQASAEDRADPETVIKGGFIFIR